MNNKELIKKRPNSAKDIKNEQVLGNQLYNNSTKKNLFLQSNYLEKEQEHFKFSPQIDKNSKKIFQKNYNLITNLKVEDRLISFGNKLKQKILHEKTNFLLNNIKDYSFSPKIDNFSRYIAQNAKSERINKLKLIEDYLTINNNKSLNKKRTKIKIMNLNKHLDKRNQSQGNKQPKDNIQIFVSFGDYLNNNVVNEEKGEKKSCNSKEKFDTYNPEKNIFDCLYLESKLDKINKLNKINENINNRYTFRPLISNSAKKLKKNNKESKKEFIERMSSFGKKDKRYEKEKIKENSDNNSFRPKITRGPKKKKQREIDENLKGYYDKRIIKHKENLKNNEKINNMVKKKYYIKKSSELIMKMKYEKYKELFQKLDSDNDGQISYDKIKLTGINNDMLTEISPILGELHDSKKTLDFKTFYNKVHNLFTDKNHENFINH